MPINQFFQNKGPFPLKRVLEEVESDLLLKDHYVIKDIQNLENASHNEITFLHNRIIQMK